MSMSRKQNRCRRDDIITLWFLGPWFFSRRCTKLILKLGAILVALTKEYIPCLDLISRPWRQTEISNCWLLLDINYSWGVLPLELFSIRLQLYWKFHIKWIRNNGIAIPPPPPWRDSTIVRTATYYTDPGICNGYHGDRVPLVKNIKSTSASTLPNKHETLTNVVVMLGQRL